MSRFPRNYIKTIFFHVITQGINKSYIFEKSEDIKYHIKTMYKLSAQHEIKIIAYCIMNNHVHMLIETYDIKELSKYMQRLNTTYAKYYNKKYNRIGYVFRDRYKSEGIYNEEQLYNCIKYIYDNPVKAGICNRPEEYPYSNYKKINKNLKENYIFIDIEDDKKTSEEVIQDYLTENDVKLEELKNDKIRLKEIIVILKKEYNFSLREIAEKMMLGREKIRRIYKE